MESSTEISNLALSHLAIGKQVANIDSEKSTEARACRMFFDIARDAVLRDFAWPFATRLFSLGLVETNPNDEWGFSYRMPSDCVQVRRILSGIRNDTRASRVPYIIGSDNTALLIYTDAESATAEYTLRETRVNLYPPDFCIALSLRLAAYIAPQLTGGDPFRLGERSMKMYVVELSKAQASAFNEEQSDQAPEAESIQARE